MRTVPCLFTIALLSGVTVGCSTVTPSSFAAIFGTSSLGQSVRPISVDGVALQYEGYKPVDSIEFAMSPGVRTVGVIAFYSKQPGNAVDVVTGGDQHSASFQFKVEAHKRYVVRSRLEGDVGILWIEDAGTGQTVTEEVRFHEDTRISAGNS